MPFLSFNKEANQYDVFCYGENKEVKAITFKILPVNEMQNKIYLVK